MRKFRVIGLSIVAVLLLALAACTPAASTPDTGAQATQPEGAGPTVLPGGVGGDGANSGMCVSVDTNQLMNTGQSLYNDQCASCHGEQGEGVGNFPALTGNTVVTGQDIVGLVQGYFAVDAHPKTVTAEDLSALLTYSRGAFGNTGTVICPEDIQIPVTQ